MKNKENLGTPEFIKFIPTTSFGVADVNSDAQLFYSFIKESRGERWAHVFKRSFPELIQELKGVKEKEEAMKICEKFSKDFHDKNRNEILIKKVELQTEWQKISEEFLGTLADHFETTWPEEKQEIIGNITVLPIFPRYLDKYSFCVGYQDIQRMIETSAHEIVHFLWFKKWKEVFPESKRRDYESPHLAWRLSEIIDPIILHCQPKINSLIKPKGWGYSSFETIKIGDISMTEHFKKVYTDSVSTGNDFATTMKLLWLEA